MFWLVPRDTLVCSPDFMLLRFTTVSEKSCQKKTVKWIRYALMCMFTTPIPGPAFCGKSQKFQRDQSPASATTGCSWCPFFSDVTSRRRDIQLCFRCITFGNNRGGSETLRRGLIKSSNQLWCKPCPLTVEKCAQSLQVSYKVAHT